MQRLVDLILESSNDTAAFNAISNLARMELRSLISKIADSLERCGDKMDAYSKAHLAETVQRAEGHWRRATPTGVMLHRHPS